jgi:hypothetical protein
MKPTEMPTYRETENHWLTGLLRQKQELSIQLAKLDLEIGTGRGLFDRVRGLERSAFPSIASLSSRVTGDGMSPSGPNSHIEDSAQQAPGLISLEPQGRD